MKPSARPRRVRHAVSAAAAVSTASLALAPVAVAQTPGTQTSNPFPNPIPTGNIVVEALPVATLPTSNNSPARMNSSAVSPDGRFFVLDQRGTAYAVGGGAATSYLNLNGYGLSLLNDDGERGAAQIAFSPQFLQAGTPGYGKLYASFSTSNLAPTPDFSVAGQGRTHDEVVYEFTTANPTAATFTEAAGVAPRQVLRLAQPATNHNGGGLGFNPNAVPGTTDYGALYYSSGDGGGGGDPFAQGQNPATPFASILRVDPLGTNGTGGDHGIVADNAFAADGNAGTLAEVYAYGLRNPQRFGWDVGGSKKMYAGDVGQGTVEEIDVIQNGKNYGWSQREGSFVYVNGNTVAIPPSPDAGGYTNPIAEYDHSEGIAVTGGFVYRGSAIPALTGKYVFGDLAYGRVFYVDADQAIGGGQDVIRELRLTGNYGATEQSLLQLIDATAAGAGSTRADLRLGQDAGGNLYLLNKHDGVVRELVAVPEPVAAGIVAGAAALAAGRRRARTTPQSTGLGRRRGADARRE